ncbi:MAG: hypothetical protein LBO20_01775 [Bifidobacteriaceae bacterium]|nr:hypothetical protein [Bifidobacteriaceae bacterium]
MGAAIGRGVGWGAVGAAVALAASIWHRARLGGDFPVGMALACLAVAAVAVAGRAAAGWPGVIGVAVGVFVVSQAVALRGPGGDILVQGDVLGFAWIAGAPVLTLVAALLPARWFQRSAPGPASFPSA